MTIGRKISATCAVVVSLTVALAVASLVSISGLSGAVGALQADSIPGLRSSGRIHVLANEVRIRMNAELLDLATNGGKDAARKQSDLVASQAKYTGELKSYEKSIFLAENREVFASLGPAFDRAIQSWSRVRAVAAEGKLEEAVNLYRSATVPAFDDLERCTESLAAYNDKSARAEVESATAAAATARAWNWSVALIAVVCGSLLPFFIVRGVNRALRQAASELSLGAEQVSSAAGQIAAASQSLAQGSSEQAASIEETSASTEEVNSMARKNVDNSRSAADLVTSSERKFAQTNQSLEKMVVAMGEISSSSEKISKIIKVIDEIAFQTNILALNAAVEAARAGEAGMGFAVVADEVRNLAQRCAQAAQDTAALIEESITKSSGGKTRVDRVAQDIREITAESDKVKALVGEVNLSSEEQARGIDQIGRAISQMEQVTQKSAANAEQSAAAAEELTAQSKALKDVIGRLTGMVGGGDSRREPGRGSASGRHKALAAHKPKPAALRTPALKTRALPKGPAFHDGPVLAHAMAPVSASSAADEAFPLDREF